MKFLLETGRTHQIRVHSAYAGHPVAEEDGGVRSEKVYFRIAGTVPARKKTWIYPSVHPGIHGI